ncbi:23S rRNA (adenine(2503)-C(2))-methyltransferase RlmN [bacterium SCSIO 12643]|nr:23S rRNA (adenine(2503)-C(2))-methyltransferase RlmN [bacterium SCSIO 12643]
MSKIDIRKLSLDEIISHTSEYGFEKFRARQIHNWLWNKSAKTFDEMLNLSKKHREILNEHFEILPVTIAESQKSIDGTFKYALELHDHKIIEGVLIPTETRNTACVSSQVGCSLACSFCATGKLKMMRNIDAAEIYDQVSIINDESKKHYGKGLTNIVFMGMGEPLLNYRNLLGAIDKITSPEGLGMASRRLTVSTAGIAKAIKRLGDDEVKFNLAVSLHAAMDSKRDKIMAINESNNLDVLMDALKYFYQKTGNKITFEYILFKGFNDTKEDVRALANLCAQVPSKVNIIEYNSIDDSDFSKSTRQTTEEFQAFLKYKGVDSQVRKSRGDDIDAACGQLANKNGAALK